MTIKEIYEQAIILIETRGWFSKEIDKDSKEVCLVMALQIASRSHENNYYLNLFIDAHSRLKSLIDTDSLIRWNDTPGRTKEEVIELLRKGIALCE